MRGDMRQKYYAFIRDRRFLGALLAVTFAYVTCFAFLRNPLLEDNTASLIGLDYPLLFFFWQLLVGLSLVYGILAVYHIYGCPEPLRTVGKIAAWTSPPCQAIIYFVHADIENGEIVYLGVKREIHWAATIIFMLAVLLSAGIAFYGAGKKVRRFNALLIAIGAVALAMAAVFFTVGKSGLFETAPLWALLAMLFLVHCTKLFRIP